MKEGIRKTGLFFVMLVICTFMIFTGSARADAEGIYPDELVLGAGYGEMITTSGTYTNYIKVELTEGGKLTIGCMSYGGSVFVKLANSERTHFYKINDNKYDFDAYGTALSPGTNSYTYYVPAGTYYVQCNTYGSANYKIKASLQSYDLADRGFDSYDSPTVIKLDKTYTGILSNIYQNRSTSGSTYDNDWFRLDLDKAGTYSFNLCSVDKIYMKYELYKGDDLNNKYLTADMSSGWPTPPATQEKSVELQPGTYYLKVCYTIEPALYRFSVTQIISAPADLTSKLKKYNSVKLKWNPVNDADAYEVYYSKGNSSNYKRYTRTSSTSCTIKGLKAGINYNFKVRAYAKQSSGVSYGPESFTSIRTLKSLPAPSVKKSAKSKVKVNWSKMKGASGYQLSVSNKKAKTTIKYTGSSRSAKIKVKKGVKYYFKVRAYALSGSKKVYAPWSEVKEFKLK